MNFEDFSALISEIAHVPMREIHEDATFRDDLGVDSLQLVHLITAISEKLSVGMACIQSNEDLRTAGSLYRAFQRGVQQ
jgi:acyl carrier protein